MSKSPSSSTKTSIDTTRRPESSWSLKFLIIALVVPVLLAILVLQLFPFDPAPYPPDAFPGEPMIVPKVNAHILEGAEIIGAEIILQPEDIAYDPNSGKIYAGCSDGWIKCFTLNDSVKDTLIENWINTGGRPLGVIIGHYGEVIIADGDKGLLNATDEGIQLLTDEVDGVKFKLTDGVDIAEDGIIYFTDASSKYSLAEVNLDSLEGRPYGRFMSYDPSTKVTQLLLEDLYFANGVAVSPDQTFVIICETPVRRCQRYYIKGEKTGSMDIFIDNLPGQPDNIRYDEETGEYWIGLITEVTWPWYIAMKYPFIRKIWAIREKLFGRSRPEKNAGVLSVDLDGNPKAHYYDRSLTLVTGAIRVGDNLYLGFLVKPYVMRLNATKYPAVPTE